MRGFFILVILANFLPERDINCFKSNLTFKNINYPRLGQSAVKVIVEKKKRSTQTKDNDGRDEVIRIFAEKVDFHTGCQILLLPRSSVWHSAFFRD